MKLTTLALAFLLAAATPVVTWAQTAQSVAEDAENELNITAERMEVLLDGKTIELTNNVRFEDDTMVLTADRMLILLEENQSKNKNDGAAEKGKSSIPGADDNASMKLRRLDAFGNVILRKKLDATESAMGDNASYDVKTDCVTLTGDCLITQGDKSMRGHEVVFDRTHQKISVRQASIRIKLPKNNKKNGLGGLLGNKKTSDKAK